MVKNTLIVQCLTNAGASVRQAEAFERWLEDSRPVGIGVMMLERAISRQLAHDASTYGAALASLTRENERMENELAQQRFDRTSRLF